MRYRAYSVKDEIKMLDGDVIGAKKTINVAGGGLGNGNAYAEVQVIYIDKEMTKPNAVFYQEFGNNPLRKLIGDDIEWLEDDDFKVLDDGNVEDDSDEEEEEEEDEDEFCMYNGTIASRKQLEYLYRDEFALQKILDKEDADALEYSLAYKCDAGCGKVVGGSSDSDCDRFCKDCMPTDDKEDEEEEEEDKKEFVFHKILDKEDISELLKTMKNN